MLGILADVILVTLGILCIIGAVSTLFKEKKKAKDWIDFVWMTFVGVFIMLLVINNILN